MFEASKEDIVAKLVEFGMEHDDSVDKWRLAQMTSGLRQMGKEAILELLNSIEDEHKNLLEGYFRI